MKEQIMNVVKAQLVEILPELEGKDISPDETLVNLGADSVDRGELITLSMERLNYDGSRIEFANAQTLNDLVTIFQQKIK